MKRKLLFLYFDFLRYFNDGDPSMKEVSWATSKLTVDDISYKIVISMIYYEIGNSLERIADAQKVTRERIRQHILKGCSVARRLK